MAEPRRSRHEPRAFLSNPVLRPTEAVLAVYTNVYAPQCFDGDQLHVGCHWLIRPAIHH